MRSDGPIDANQSRVHDINTQLLLAFRLRLSGRCAGTNYMGLSLSLAHRIE